MVNSVSVSALDQKMKLVAWDENGITGTDTYAVKFEVDSEDTYQDEAWEMDGSKKSDTYQDTADSAGLGLFKVDGKNKQNADSGNDLFTPIQTTISTGPLSFVTDYDEDGKVDTSKGVKLLIVNYTVAADMSNRNAYISGTQGTGEAGDDATQQGIITTESEEWKETTSGQ